MNEEEGLEASMNISDELSRRLQPNADDSCLNRSGNSTRKELQTIAKICLSKTFLILLLTSMPILSPPMIQKCFRTSSCSSHSQSQSPTKSNKHTSPFFNNTPRWPTFSSISMFTNRGHKSARRHVSLTYACIFLFLLYIHTSGYAVNCQQPKPDDDETVAPPPAQEAAAVVTPAPAPGANAGAKAAGEAATPPEFVSDPPVNVRLVECSGNGATLQWEPPATSNVLKYVVLGHLQGAADNDLKVLGEVPAPQTQFRANLESGSNYTFKVASVNQEEFYSKPSEATELCSMPGDVPKHNPLNVVGKGTDPSNMVITWDPVPRETWNGPGFHYKVEYKPRDQQNWESADVTDPEATSYTVKDIKEFTPYDIKVTSYNNMGPARDPPTVVVGFSGEDKPSAKPENLQLVEILNGSMARVSWTPIKDEDFKGPPEGYKVKVTAEDKTKEVKVPPRTDNAIINILTPNTENMVRVAAYNRKFDGPDSDEIVINTPESAPGAPDHLKGYPLGPHSARITWKQPVQKNGKIIGYRVMYAPVDQVGNPIEPEREATIMAQNEVYLTDLRDSTNYRASVTAATSAGYGTPATVTFQTTHAGEPDKPQFSVNVANGGFNVSQLPSPNPGAFFYLVYRKEGGKWFSTPMEVAGKSKMIKNVSENTNYEIQMIAVNGNNSQISDPQKFLVPLERAPNQPINVNVDRCDAKETTLSWKVKPVDKSPITSFIIEHKQEGTEEWKELESNHPANVEQFVITDLPAGRHRFRVTAANREGNSSPSEETEVCEITKADIEEEGRKDDTLGTRAFGRMPKSGAETTFRCSVLSVMAGTLFTYALARLATF